MRDFRASIQCPAHDAPYETRKLIADKCREIAEQWDQRKGSPSYWGGSVNELIDILSLLTTKEGEL